MVVVRALGWFAPLLSLLVAAPAFAQANPLPGRLSMDGVVRASAIVDSVFLDRTKPAGDVEGGDWASYLLARLGAGPIPDSVGIEVAVDTAEIEVRGRLQDLPEETRVLLGPVARMVDSNTVIVATVLMQRTGPQILRFWLRGLTVGGLPMPEFVLASMMASVGRQYPALTKSGRDLYVQVPADAVVSLGVGSVHLGIGDTAPGAGAGRPPQ
ncbi:MAG: hypothetical protein R2882_00880 [Gemmatimonadales bacterium]